MAAIPIPIIGQAFQFAMGLLAAHDARVQAAKEENAALNQATAAYILDIKTIFQGLNQGVITEAVAAQAMQYVANWYWAFMAPVQQGSLKGAAACTSGQAKCSGTACTAGCCVGCLYFVPTLKKAVAVIQAHGGALAVPAVAGNKYGYSGMTAFSVTYKKPAKVAEAEVTINAQNGVVTIGATPTQADKVIATGAINPNATPDAGGVEITEAQAETLDSLAGQLGLTQNQILILGALAAGLFALLLFGGRGSDEVSAQPQIIVVPAG